LISAEIPFLEFYRIVITILTRAQHRRIERKEVMQSVITSKFQTTIPKAIHKNLKLSVRDYLEWKIEKGKVVIYPSQKKFLQYRNAMKTGRGDVSTDIERARNLEVEK
jgi:bifunctional DNA-binding transcriptional regulator/antitoxin component of YhaV-PrlF toxin-antitoxin module